MSTQFDSVLCFGDSDWWYHNRGHADMQFMRRFARRWPTLYVNSLGMRAPSIREGTMFFRRVGRKLLSMTRYCRDGGEGFTVLSPVYLPGVNGTLGRMMARSLGLQIRTVLRVLGMRRPLVWVACPAATRVIGQLPRAGMVHQLSDYYEGMKDGDAAAAAEMQRSIAGQADVIVCASRPLLEYAQRLYGRGDYLDHGVDFDLFCSAARRNCVPEELHGVRRPIAGFFGNIDQNTVDLELLQRVIRLRPEYSFVLVGPMAAQFEVLKQLPNVVAVPQRPYTAIPDYGAAFDVCLMPWLQNEWISYCNPVKLKEYLALGKPVVSTPFQELRRCGSLCYEARGEQEFADAIDRALAEDSDERKAQRRAWAAEHTWDAKFNRVLELLRARGISGDA